MPIHSPLAKARNRLSSVRCWVKRCSGVILIVIFSYILVVLLCSCRVIAAVTIVCTITVVVICVIVEIMSPKRTYTNINA